MKKVILALTLFGSIAQAEPVLVVGCDFVKDQSGWQMASAVENHYQMNPNDYGYVGASTFSDSGYCREIRSDVNGGIWGYVHIVTADGLQIKHEQDGCKFEGKNLKINTARELLVVGTLIKQPISFGGEDWNITLFRGDPNDTTDLTEKCNQLKPKL